MIGEALRSIAALLPASWRVEDRARILADGTQVDAAIDLTAPTEKPSRSANDWSRPTGSRRKTRSTPSVMQAIDTPDLVRGFAIHREEEHAAVVTAEAIEVYRTHASPPQGRIALLAASAAQADPTVAPAFAAQVTDLLSAL